MASAIVSLAALKSRLDKTSTADDDDLQATLDGASGLIELFTGRAFEPDPPLDENGDDTGDPVVRTVYLPRLRGGRWHSHPGTYHWPHSRTINIPDARVIESVAPVGATLTGWEALGEPPYRRMELFSLSVNGYETVRPAVQITGRFGFSPAPSYVADLVLTVAARRWKEREAQWADTVQLPEGGLALYFRQFPMSVQVTLDLLRRRARLR